MISSSLLAIDTSEGMVDFRLSVIVALIVSTLAARVRRYALAADARALTAEALSNFTHRFDKFYRARPAEQLVTGNGLVLAICRGFLEIMAGTTEASNRDDRAGTAFIITRPTATS